MDNVNRMEQLYDDTTHLSYHAFEWLTPDAEDAVVAAKLEGISPGARVLP